MVAAVDIAVHPMAVGGYGGGGYGGGYGGVVMAVTEEDMVVG